MLPSSDFHRTTDGWIDFDFYRREAARQRALAQRRAGRRLRRAFGDLAHALFSLTRRERPPRITLRKGFT